MLGEDMAAAAAAAAAEQPIRGVAAAAPSHQAAASARGAAWILLPCIRCISRCDTLSCEGRESFPGTRGLG